LDKIGEYDRLFPNSRLERGIWRGTVFLRAKKDLTSLPWFDPTMNRVPASCLKEFGVDMEIFKRVHYQRNCWVLLCKITNSFHAVEPVKCLAPLARCVFIMTLKIS
jgi:hypothetical protein